VVSLGTLLVFFFSVLRLPPASTLFPYTTLFRSLGLIERHLEVVVDLLPLDDLEGVALLLEQLPERLVVDRIAFLFQLLRFDAVRSEEHTSELQSRFDLVCRLLLEKKKQTRLPAP